MTATPAMVAHVSAMNDGVEHDLSTSEPDCVCGPTVQPVPADDGSMGWLIVHHSLDGREPPQPPGEPPCPPPRPSPR